MYPFGNNTHNHLKHLLLTSVFTIILILSGTVCVNAGQIHTDSISGSTPTQVTTGRAQRQINRPIRPQRRNISPISQMPDTIDLGQPVGDPIMVVGDSLSVAGDSIDIIAVDSILVAPTPVVERKFEFTPDPTRAVWMSALFPGLGQLYNRRYWKLPIVIGAFMGLGYATSWNNTMLRDYTTAYSDIMDNDPTTNSYMDFFAPTVKEENLDHAWLSSLLRSRKNYYRRNRDLCIICMIGVYMIAMVDAYVDAQLAHFDIGPSLSMDVAPALMNNDIRSGTSRPSLGLYWALNF